MTQPHPRQVMNEDRELWAHTARGPGRPSPGRGRPETWAGVGSAKVEGRSVPARRDSTCQVPQDAQKTRCAFWSEHGQKSLGAGCGVLRGNGRPEDVRAVWPRRHVCVYPGRKSGRKTPKCSQRLSLGGKTEKDFVLLTLPCICHIFHRKHCRSYLWLTGCCVTKHTFLAAITSVCSALKVRARREPAEQAAGVALLYVALILLLGQVHPWGVGAHGHSTGAGTQQGLGSEGAGSPVYLIPYPKHDLWDELKVQRRGNTPCPFVRSGDYNVTG